MGRRNRMIDTLGRQRELLEVLVTQLREKNPETHADCLFCKRNPSVKKRQRKKKKTFSGGSSRTERISGRGKVSLYTRAEMRAVNILGGYTRPAGSNSKKKSLSQGPGPTGGVL